MENESDFFAWLTRPLDPAEFERDFYEKRVCVVHRKAPDYYRGLLSLEDLDHVLGTHAVRFPDITIVQKDREIPSSDYTGEHSVVDPVRAARLFSEGATLVFAQLHTHLPALAQLCMTLCRLFSARMQTNIYLTPANSQGFLPHWDTHDVFVLQITGSKLWTIYDTKIALPLRGQGFDSKLHSAGPPTLEFELQAGDMAYVPRGAMHAARSTSEASLHVTTGLIGYTWADFLLQGVAAAAIADETMRENLPFRFARTDYPAEERAAWVREKLGRVDAFIEADPPFAYFSGELVAHNRPCLTNLLRQVSDAGQITLSSTLRRRPDSGWHLQERESSCVVRCYGNEIELPLFVSPVLRFVLDGRSFRVGEIPDHLDDAGKLTLVRRLVKEGILECLEARA